MNGKYSDLLKDSIKMEQEDPKWKLAEKVVKLIEQAISPNAQVKHNVWLPDLTKASKSRQCDIVIWSGNPPRETITLVEVQDRDESFDINTFDGLCVKMRKVGAQHLICVSRQDFPESIKTEAKQRGPTVRLVLLKDLENGKWPVNIIDNCAYLFKQKVIKIGDVKISVKKGGLPSRINSNQTSQDKVIRIEGYQDLHSFNDLINIYFKESDLLKDLIKFEKDSIEIGCRSMSIHFPFPGQKLWWEQHDKKNELIALDFVVDIEIEKVKIPIKISSYHQLDDDSALAWVMDITFIYNNQEVKAEAIIVPTDDSNYRVKVWNLPDLFSVDFIEI